MEWDEGDLARRIFDILFPPAEVVQRAEEILAQRRVRFAEGRIQEGIVQRDRQPAEDGAQVEIARWDRPPAEGGEQIVRRRREPAEGGEQIVRRRRQLAEGEAQEVIALRGRQPADRGAQAHVAQVGEGGGAQGHVVQLGRQPAEVGAQANVIQLGGQPGEVGAGENRNIMEEGLINISQFFRSMDLNAFAMCRMWFVLLLGSFDPDLTNEQKQMIEGFRASLYYLILSKETVNSRIFVILKSELERVGSNVPHHVTRVLAKRALRIVEIGYDFRPPNYSSAEQGVLGTFNAFFNIILFILVKIFLFIFSFIPLLGQKFFLPPPDRRFQNGHRSPR